MPILVRCPSCRKPAEVSRGAVGMNVQCRACKGVFPVPLGSGHLTIEWGLPLVGTQVALVPPNEIKIGRGDDNDLVLPGAKVSRHHTRIFWRDDEWIVQDLGSGNGTFINGAKIRETRLENHVGLAIGDFLIRVTVAYTALPGHDTATPAAGPPPGTAQPPMVHDADARASTVVGVAASANNNAARPPAPRAPIVAVPPRPPQAPHHPPPRTPSKAADKWLRGLIAFVAVVLAGVVLYMLFFKK